MLVQFNCHFWWQVQYLVQLKLKCYFSWQAQHLVMLQSHFSWQVHHLVMLPVAMSLCGRCTFGDVGVSLFVAGAAICEPWNDSWNAKSYIFNTKCSWWARKVASVARRVAGSRFHARIILGPFPHCKWRCNCFRKFSEILESPFSWQAQYFVMLGGHICCSAQCKWCVMRDEDQSWESFFVAGAIFVMLEGNLCCFAQCYVTRINHEGDFAWQAQYLVKLEDDSWCSA